MLFWTKFKKDLKGFLMASRKNKKAFPELLDETDKDVIALRKIFDALIDEDNPPLPENNTVADEIPADDDIAKENKILSITDTHEFVQTFQRLDYAWKERILLKLFDRYHFGDKTVDLKHKFDKRQSDKDKLIDSLEYCGMTWVHKMHYPLHRQEKHIIRIDYYGTVNKPRTDQLSPQYAQALKNQEEFPKESYKIIRKSPVWKLFRHAKSFRLIEGKVITQLQKMKIPPETLMHMNSYDFSDVLFEAFNKKKDHTRDKGNATLFLGARQRFVKDFIRKNKKSFIEYLQRHNVDERYISALVQSMETKGITSNIKPLNEKYTPEIIKALKKHGLNTSDLRTSQKISEEHKKFLYENHLDNLLIATDKDGHIITGPQFSVHHKIAVQDSSEQPNLAQVNYFQNLCLVVDVTYHRDIFHGLDETSPFNNREAYSARIYLKREDTVFFGGLDPQDQIFYDYTKDPRTLRRKNIDEPQDEWEHIGLNASEPKKQNTTEIKTQTLQNIMAYREEYLSQNLSEKQIKQNIKKIARQTNISPALIEKLLNIRDL